MLDGLLHAIAYAPREALSGDYLDAITRSAFAIAHDVSSYSFAALAKGARPLMQGRPGSLLTLSYLGAMRTVPNYNVMGLAKASLESNVRYLATCLGPEGLRVNGISAGPIKTLAAAGIGNFSRLPQPVREGRAAAPQRHHRRGRQRRRVLLLRAVLRDHRRDHLRRLRLLDHRRRDGRRRFLIRDDRARPPLRRRHRRRRPQRARLRGVPRGGGASRLRARAPRHPRRRGGHRGVPSRLSQLDGELHRQPAQPEDHPRPAARRARPRHRPARAVELPAAAGRDGRRLPRGRRRPRRDAGGGREVLARAMRSGCRRTTRCSTASPTCCATCCSRRRPTSGAGCPRCSTAGRWRSASARSTFPASATCSLCSPRARATCSTPGSSRRRSRPRSASTPSWATSRARTRPDRRTCCCTTCSARSTASADSGATPAAGWARSPRRWRASARRAA